MPKAPYETEKRTWKSCPCRIRPSHSSRLTIESVRQSRSKEDVLDTALKYYFASLPPVDLAALTIN